ncbi:hypothetical protein [Brevundimonas bullata]|uniref:hypothetical protein n=1 Tax=Brevundimonas bullata TaxID=13160 RepID=UPI003D9AAA12
MTIPTSGTFTSDTVRNEWGFGLPFTSTNVSQSAGLGTPWTSEQLRGLSSFSATITPTAFYASGRSDGRRPGTAQVSGNITATGGVAPYTYGHQLANQSGYAPTVSVGATGSITVRYSSTLESYLTGEVRGVVTDSQGKVTYTRWVPYELQISSLIIGPEV